MLPSTGYFKGINCPFYESGLCERPYCHFRHAKKEICESNNDSFENGEILQQLVSEAVKKVLQHTDSNASDKDGAVHSQSLITKVVQELSPATTNKSVSSTTKVTYNPTPISELNKLMPSTDDFQPAPSRKEYLNRKHIPVPYTPHRPSRSHTARATTKLEIPCDRDIKSFSSRHAELDKYTPVAMECESSVKYLPGSLVEHKPTPYSPISTDPNHQQSLHGSAYTPTDIANISEMNVSCYTPSGQSISGVTYSPGAAVSADYSTSSYCPNNTSYSANNVGSKSPCYTSSLSYQPTPLCKTINPKFSSDEDDEPTIKKARVTESHSSKADFQGLEDLDSEFEMLGEILDDENESAKKPLKVIAKSSKNDAGAHKPDRPTLDFVDLPKISPAPISNFQKMSKNHSKSSSSSSKVNPKGHSRSEHKLDASSSKGQSKSELKSDIASSSKIHSKNEIKSTISSSKPHSKSESKSDTSSSKGHSKSDVKSDTSSISKGHSKSEIKFDTASGSRSHSKSDKNELKSDTVSSSRGHSKNEHKLDSAKDRKTSKSSNGENEKVNEKRENEKVTLKKESSSEKHSKKREDGRAAAKDNDKDRHSTSDKSKSHKSSTSRSESKCSESKSEHHHKSKSSSNSSSSKSKSHISKSSSSDKKSSTKDYKSKEASKHDSTAEGHKKSSKERHKEKEKSQSKSDKSSRRSKEKQTLEISKAPPEDSLSDTELIEEFSDSDEEKITEECLRIFEEYVPSAKEVVNPQHSSTENVPKTVMCQITGKKRVAHNTNQTIYRTPSTVLPDHKAKAVQLVTDRFSKVKQFHDSRMKRISTENLQTQFQPPREEPSVSAVTSSSKIRIAHVPNVSTLLHAKKALRVPEPPKCTVVQTVTKGVSRVAHMPNDKFCERPGVLEPLASKIAVNIRSRYLNLMIDECLKIYLNPEDAYGRAQHEELNTNKKCTSIPIYKNSAVLTISRLRKEVQEAGGIKISNSMDVGQSSISHSKVLLGKLADSSSWSIENKYKKDNESSKELKGERFYENISKWILTEEELRENGFPRPHPEKKDKGLAKIFTVNTRQKPQKGNVRLCCRCKKEYTVDKKGIATVKEDCIYHPNNKYRFRGEVKYQCCGQDATSDGCLSASCHVYEYVDHDNLRGFVKTLPLDDQSGDQQDYRVYALDCEMCYTSNGLDLTRVTVIDNTLTVVYESLVKPLYPIIDYNTRYSGLTEEHLRDVTTTLLEVQATFLHMFSDKTILVGHSLESDFKALKLIHDTVVDTSVLFPHKMGPPYKRALRNLSSEYLKKIIQNSLDGHDSAEDATVCMELLIWKLKEELKTR